MASADDGEVDEAALADGSNPESPNETDTGTFTIGTFGDGLAALTVGGIDVRSVSEPRPAITIWPPPGKVMIRLSPSTVLAWPISCSAPSAPVKPWLSPAGPLSASWSLPYPSGHHDADSVGAWVCSI